MPYGRRGYTRKRKRSFSGSKRTRARRGFRRGNGTRASRQFATARGFGAYHYKNNVLMSGGSLLPIIKNSGAGFIVRHREYLGDISGTEAFTLAQYPINPGQRQTFPWLSLIAQRFEQYEIQGMVFEFRSMSSDTGTTSSNALGTVIMGTDYDSLDAPFSGKQEMENHEFSNSSKPSASFLHPIECARGQSTITRLYVRPAGLPANADLRLYDLGLFQIATQGMNSAGVGTSGELWISYQIKLLKPQLESEGVNLLSDHYYFSGTNVVSPTTSPIPATITPTVQGRVAGSSTSGPFTFTKLSLATSVNARVEFGPFIDDGVYMVLYSLSGATAVTVGGNFLVFTSLANCVQGNSFNNLANDDLTPVMVIANALLMGVTFIKVTGATASFVMHWEDGDANSLPSGAQQIDLWISQVADYNAAV